MRFEIVKEVFNKSYYLWCGKDMNNLEYVVEIYVKQDGGMKHFVFRMLDMKLDSDLVDDCLRYGVFSIRPYKLGQSCDGSIGHPVLSLFDSFCKSRNLDTVRILNEAYPDEESDYDFEFINKMANWQGIQKVKIWNDENVKGLLKSLHEINYHSLCNLLQEKYL